MLIDDDSIKLYDENGQPLGEDTVLDGDDVIILYDENGQQVKIEYIFYKDEDNPNNIVWEVDHLGYIGELLFSFDKKKIYNLWQDYPHNFTPEEKEIFDREYPYWADFFKDRSYNPNKE